MSTFIGMIIWSIASYFIAKTVKENQGLDINPWYYLLTSLLLGFACTMCFLWYKWAKAKDSSVGKILSIIGIFAFLVLSVLVVL